MSSSDSQKRRIEQAADWLVRISLSAPPEAEVKDWIEWCASDERNLQALEAMAEVWSTLGNHPPAPDMVSALLSADAEEAAGSPARAGRARWAALHSRWRWLSWTLAGTAASALLALCLYGLLGARLQTTVLTSKLGQHRVVALSDGSRLELGGLSIVRVDFTRHQRLLTVEQGEAYFQESHHLYWPFVVAAGHLRAVAIGTAFDVIRNRDEAAVSVVNGTVDVSIAERPASAGRQRSHQTVELQPGGQLVVLDAGTIQQNLVDPASIVAWRQGELECPDAPLGEFVQEVDRYAHRPIVIPDAAIGSLRYTGTAFTQSIDSWVDSLPKVFPITVDRTSRPGVIILKPR